MSWQPAQGRGAGGAEVDAHIKATHLHSFKIQPLLLPPHPRWAHWMLLVFTSYWGETASDRLQGRLERAPHFPCGHPTLVHFMRWEWWTWRYDWKSLLLMLSWKQGPILEAKIFFVRGHPPAHEQSPQWKVLVTQISRWEVECFISKGPEWA